MKLSDILDNFLSLTQDAVAIGYRGPADVDGCLAYTNASYNALFCYEADQVLGRSVRISHDPDSWEDYLSKETSFYQAGADKFQTETMCIRSDGTKFWASTSDFNIDDPETDGRYTCTTFRDISPHKEREGIANRALKNSDALLDQERRKYQDLLAEQNRLLSAMHAFPDPFVIYDKDLRLVMCNTAYRYALSNDPDAIQKGMHIRDVVGLAFDCGQLSIPEEGRQAALDKLEELRTVSSKVKNVELPGDVHHRIRYNKADNGDSVIVRLDISELVRERRQSYQTHARTIAALNAYPDPFAIYDRDARLVMWNQAFRKSVTDNQDDLVEGMTSRAVEALAIRSGRVGTELLHLSKETIAASEMLHHLDRELPGDNHRRALRSRAPNGDIVVIQMDTTELVRQRRTAEESQERLLASIEAYPSPFCLYDSASRLIIWNDSYARAITDNPSELYRGMSLEDVIRLGFKNARLVVVAEDEDIWLQDRLRSMNKTIPVEDLELVGDQHYRLRRSRSDNGDLTIVMSDTTELVRQRRALEKTKNRLISAVKALPDPFSIYDQNLRLMLWNPAYEKAISNNGKELHPGMHVSDVLRIAIGNGFIPQAAGREEEWIADYVNVDMLSNETEDFEFADDQFCRIIRSRTESGETLVLRLDVTEAIRQRRALERYAHQLEEANHQITFEALHDQLTGLGNRRYLTDKFNELSRQRRQKGGQLAALHIDLDRFKQINDTIGHAAGDQVLIDVANRLRSNVRDDDVVARIGGDEFVILLWIPDGSERPAHLAEALLRDLVRPSFFEGRECRFGASIGIAQTPLADESELLTNSDVALYKAKRAGRGQLAIFDQSDIREMRETKQLADDILRGLEQEEFVSFYQPQVDAQTGQVVGVEALARWLHPDQGVLTPDYFLDVATDLNVVSDIDRMIFERSIAECESALGGLEHPPSLSFNISANRLQFHEIAEIGRLSQQYPGDIAFELLETIFLEEESNAFMMQLDLLRDIGISLEMDDFGSGRASIVALQRVAPDRLKIDRRLVSPMAYANNATRLVKSIIEIGHALDIEVIAEGVETAEQARILRELGAGRLQGYFFSRPLALSQLCNYIITASGGRTAN